MTQAGVPRLLGDDSRRMYDKSRGTAAVNDLYIPRKLSDRMVPRKWGAKLRRALVGAFCHDYDRWATSNYIEFKERSWKESSSLFLPQKQMSIRMARTYDLCTTSVRLVGFTVRSRFNRRHHRGEVLTDDIISLAINKVAALICSHLWT